MAAIFWQRWLLFDINLFLTGGSMDSTIHGKGEETVLIYRETVVRLLGKTLLDLRCWTWFQDGRHITLTWPTFDIILFFTR